MNVEQEIRDHEELDFFGLPKILSWKPSHPAEQVIGNPLDGVKTRAATQNECMYAAYLSKIEPSTYKEALLDPDWIEAMQDELAEFERNEVWSLVPPPSGHTIIGTRWVFKNKLDDDGCIIRNKARLVAQG